MSDDRSASPNNARRLGLIACGALLLVAGVWVSGTPLLDAPWLQGDEHIFIASNPDVTGEGREESTLLRWLRIFGHLHEDLYQPLTILSYAIEWQLWGDGRVAGIRRTDVLLHALNGLLLWGVVYALLLRLSPLPRASALPVGWGVAMIWSLHPMLVTTYASDMGRTHLLAAGCLLAALLCHVRAITASITTASAHAPGKADDEPHAQASRRVSTPRTGSASAGALWFGGSLLFLLAAMLNKPSVGWVLVVFGLEAVLGGGAQRALRSGRVWSVAVVCGAFAVLTILTTRRTLLLDESPLPLFGGPVERAALGLFIYLRNALVPGPWLNAYYPPDIRTGWGYPPVWIGIAAAAALLLSAFCVLFASRVRGGRGDPARLVAIGTLWALGAWLPVSGVIGARVLAAQDRYFYQPLLGLLLIGAALLAEPIARRRGAALIVAALAMLGGAAAIPLNTGVAERARSTLGRALWAAEADPNDPRLVEMLAAAYKFGWTHDTPETRLTPPPDQRALQVEALQRAAVLADAPAGAAYFLGAHDRAAFHRRLAFEWMLIGRPDASLVQAERAAAFEPHAILTLTRLAHAFQALDRVEDAIRAYAEIEQRIAPTSPDRGVLLTEFARLLLYRANDVSGAMSRFRAALQTPGIAPEVRDQARAGLARCEVLIGEGVVGLRLAEDVLALDRDNQEAALVVALYHLRSHHFQQAFDAYAALLRDDPTHYEALRNFHESCVQLGRWQPAVEAWRSAVLKQPEEPAYRSFLCWALACAGDAQAAPAADALLAELSHSPFAHLARAILALRAGAPEQSLTEIRAARDGKPISGAREADRAEATLRVMIERREVPVEGWLLIAALQMEQAQTERAAASIATYRAAAPESKWSALAEEIMRRP